MALIKCEECGKEISDKAKSCPKCGCPIENAKIIEIGNEIGVDFTKEYDTLSSEEKQKFEINVLMRENLKTYSLKITFAVISLLFEIIVVFLVLFVNVNVFILALIQTPLTYLAIKSLSDYKKKIYNDYKHKIKKNR